jgi:undecaprenyl diphosphate synthase
VTEKLIAPQKTIFSPDDLAGLNKENIPFHVAIIPDGNRRWAKGVQKQSHEGYFSGAETLINAVRAAKEIGIKVLTVYTFSTENWLRPTVEVHALFETLEKYLAKYQRQLLELGIRLNTIGNLELLPETLQVVINKTKELTSPCSDFDLVLAVNYGSRDEIVRAIQNIVSDCLEKKINPNKVDEKTITQYLDTAKWPDPDLLIRTSGERRISNFLLWQSSYTELYTEEVVWPNFTPHHLLHAVRDFQRRHRRLGAGIIN